MIARRPLLASLAAAPLVIGAAPLVIGAAPLLVGAARAAAPPPKLGDNGLYVQDWFLNSFLDLAEDLAEAQAKGKGLLVLWEQRGCIYCKQFHEVHLRIPELRDGLSARFEVLQLDLYGPRKVKDFTGRERAEKDQAAAAAVRFTPTFQFFARDAKVPPGKAAHEAETWRQNGLLPPFATHVLFKYVAEGAYRAGPFDAYLRAEHAASVASGGKAHTW